MTCDKIDISRVCREYRSGHCQELTPVWQLKGSDAYFFVSKLDIDADGAPRAYNPKDEKPPDNHTKALDWLRNLSARDQHGIQGRDGVGPEPGFVISATSLHNDEYPKNDTRHWVDAETIPYIVLTDYFPAAPDKPRVRLGDCAMVIDLKSGNMSGAIFADGGNAVGEGSLRLALNLGLDPTASSHPPKVTGYHRLDFLYITFPGAHVAPPWDVSEIQKTTTEKFKQWGGMAQVRACFPDSEF